MSYERFGFNRYCVTVGFFLGYPCFNHVLSCPKRTFQTLAVGGQIEGRNMRVIITLEFRLFDWLKKNGILHWNYPQVEVPSVYARFVLPFLSVPVIPVALALGRNYRTLILVDCGQSVEVCWDPGAPA